MAAKKRKNGRAKGKVGEREVARLLQAWWAQLEPDCIFVSTPLSGGWGGPQHRAGFNASGDLMTTAARFPFCVEVKRREAVDIRRLWLTTKAHEKSPVHKWWAQTVKAALEVKLTPMLVFRKNRGQWWVALPVGKVHSGLLGEMGLLAQTPDGWDADPIATFALVRDGHRATGFPLADLLSVKPARLLELLGA
jgi:hypothetical protein